ncbi:hypothetical protein V5E97_31970 [Singulisphaera sp. Ch08]|uniref:Uncharacterized protein n=1 Tax=Singulisphaera sp. Ch08 TaxID=3120278 RepID=A0AAU7CCV0_9BACT
MKRSCWGATAVGTILVAVVMAAGAQEQRKDRDQEPRKGQEEPRRKGMMMRGMMGPRMPMEGMMPMMMEMHRQHAAMESQWEATDQGVFVLRPDKLVKYDKDLTLVKSVDLPAPPMMPHSGEDADEPRGRPRMQRGMGEMRQMMARMHGALPAKLAVTPDAVLVSRGSRLMKFSRDLELEKSVDLVEVKPMRCPMCGHIMGNMEERRQDSRDDEN